MKQASVSPPSSIIADFFEAARNDDVATLQQVLDTYGDSLVNMKAMDGITPLMSASANGSLNALGFLLDNGADIDCQNDLGGTPLLYATWTLGLPTHGNEIACLELLLERGASLALAGKDKKTPLLAAQEQRNGIALPIIEKWLRVYDIKKISAGIERPHSVAGTKLRLQNRSKGAGL